jgi:DNA invertase Pin-like site-specific DNA recombinase
MAELIGYMRISTKEQQLDLQRDALLAAGVQERHLYQDVVSGSKQARPGLTACLKALRAGDTLVVWKLDRLARSTIHLLEVLQDLQAQEVQWRILEGLGAQLNLDTADGRLFFTMLAAFAEFEREMIRESVIAGLAAARAPGHHGGRKPALNPAKQREARILKDGGMPITEIAAKLGCCRHTGLSDINGEILYGGRS